jgi:hypothetical protein
MGANQREFDYIRSTYFPRWDRGHTWTLQEDHPECVGFGLCDYVGKAIIIRDDLHVLPAPVLLIHEIAHAVTYPGHGKKWQIRMEKAALKAESIGHDELAAELRKNYTAYSRPECKKITADLIYMHMREAVFDAMGATSFEVVAGMVANDNGMTLAALLSKYKNLRSVYDKAQKDALWQQPTDEEMARASQQMNGHIIISRIDRNR